MTAILTVSGLHAGYGEVPVLRDISFSVARGEICAIVGANGAGKTTLLSAIAGLITPSAGRVHFQDQDITSAPAHTLPERGLAMVPEGGRLFAFMTVTDNLQLGAFTRAARAEAKQRMEEVLELFPILAERRLQHAGKLSGGERQMCAIARALMSGPKVLMLDEPSIGLSPLMTEKVLDTVATLARTRKLSVIIVEQRVTEVLEIADIAHILAHGEIARTDSAENLRNDPQIQQTYMGL
jgi:branched-chain amino acid transport system ATP-binding protein